MPIIQIRFQKIKTLLNFIQNKIPPKAKGWFGQVKSYLRQWET